jgi:hypothetical protein
MDEFLKRFQPILEIYWRNKQVNLELLIHERLANPIETLTNVINLFKHYKQMFASKIPSTADIGLIQLDTKSARTKIKPTPQKYLDEMGKMIPIHLRKQNEGFKKWLEDRVRELKKPISNVEEFVAQSEFYNYCEVNFQNVRDQVDMLGQIYAVLKENEKDAGLKVKKEDEESFKESMQCIAQLANIKEGVESSQEQNKETFKKSLSKDIPVLEGEID